MSPNPKTRVPFGENADGVAEHRVVVGKLRIVLDRFAHACNPRRVEVPQFADRCCGPGAGDGDFPTAVLFEDDIFDLENFRLGSLADCPLDRTQVWSIIDSDGEFPNDVVMADEDGTRIADQSAFFADDSAQTPQHPRAMRVLDNKNNVVIRKAWAKLAMLLTHG